MIASGLPGTDGTSREAVWVKSPAKLTKALLRKQCATTADGNGAINAWIDDAGQYRCEAMRRMITLDSQIFTNLKAVRDWWKRWLKKIA